MSDIECIEFDTPEDALTETVTVLRGLADGYEGICKRLKAEKGNQLSRYHSNGRHGHLIQNNLNRMHMMTSSLNMQLFNFAHPEEMTPSKKTIEDVSKYICDMLKSGAVIHEALLDLHHEDAPKIMRAANEAAKTLYKLHCHLSRSAGHEL